MRLQTVCFMISYALYANAATLEGKRSTTSENMLTDTTGVSDNEAHTINPSPREVQSIRRRFPIDDFTVHPPPEIDTAHKSKSMRKRRRRSESGDVYGFSPVSLANTRLGFEWVPWKDVEKESRRSTHRSAGLAHVVDADQARPPEIRTTHKSTSMRKRRRRSESGDQVAPPHTKWAGSTNYSVDDTNKIRRDVYLPSSDRNVWRNLEVEIVYTRRGEQVSAGRRSVKAPTTGKKDARSGVFEGPE